MTERSRGAGDTTSGGAARSDAVRAEIDELLRTGLELHRQGNLPQAELLYRTILSVDARHADALHLLGVIAHREGRLESAHELIARAIEIDGTAAQPHFNLGLVLQGLARLPEAARAYREATRLKPDFLEAFENLGVALQDAGDFGAAEAAHRAALAIEPRSAIANQNLGTLLSRLGRFADAERHFTVVLEDRPAHAEARYKRALTLLARGDYARGWREYDWRFHADSFTGRNSVRGSAFPRWDGSAPNGRRLLITAEQGIGDELMFASCYADALAAAETCLIECDPRLSALLTRSFPDATLIPTDKTAALRWSDALPEPDLCIAAGSLPRFFRTSPESFPRTASFLRPDAERQAHWRARLAGLDAPLNVGISWRGGVDPRTRDARSIALEEWAPIFACPGINFVNLQYGDHSAEVAAFEAAGIGRLQTFPDLDRRDDLDGLVALISALDLVISIDNSTVFMAGAVGAPTWVLLPSSAEWRWHPERETSPWLPSLSLRRQPAPGLAAWRQLLAVTARDLVARFGEHGNAERTADPAGDEVTVTERDKDPVTATERGVAERGVAERGATERGHRNRVTVTRGGAKGGRAVLLNDTSAWYHFGCSCTTLAIHAQLRERFAEVGAVPIHRLTSLAPLPQTVAAFDDAALFEQFARTHGEIVAALQAADTVVVNGEGTLHNVGTAALGLLYLMHAAKTHLGKPVRLINHSCYPDDSPAPSASTAFEVYGKVYRGLDFVGVRETTSAALVAAMGVEAVPTFDCLPLFLERQLDDRHRPERDPKRVLIAGSVAFGGVDVIPALAELIGRLHGRGLEPVVLIGANAYLAGDDVRFVEALQRQCRGEFTLLAATSELEWLRAIASSALLVSGRFHHSIAAAFLDTPFVVLESNTPKIGGLLGMLEAETAFVSASEPALVDALEARAAERFASPEAFVVAKETQTRLRELSRANF